MAVNEVQTTQESKASEQEAKAKAVVELTEGIVKTMDLPEEDKSAEEETEEGAEEEETTGAEGEEAEDEEEEEESTEDGSSKESKDELVPRSEVRKLESKFERRLAQATAKIKKLESVSTKSTGDPDQERLDGMTKTELLALKREVRKSQLKAQDDDLKLEKLLDLEEKIEKTYSNYSDNFTSKQINLLNEKAQEITDAEGDALNKQAISAIKNKAAQIYNNSPVLQKSERGQAEALDLAYQHFVEIRKVLSGKDNNKDLKRKMNTLKKKTSLETSTAKGNKVSSRLKSLRDKAKGGSLMDKENLIRHDPRFGIDAIIPDEFKEE